MPQYFVRIAQLKLKGGISNRKIADILGISRNTVNSTIHKIEESGFSFKEIANMSEKEIEANFKRATNHTGPNPKYEMPNFKALAKELVRPNVTKSILWEEYRDACLLNSKRPYSQTQFNDYFREFLEQPVFSDILKRNAGEQIQVDWAGVRPCWTDPDTGEIVYGYLFGGILPFSGLAFARITGI